MSENYYDFFQKNKDKTWRLPEIPSSLKTNVEMARWLLNQESLGWLELDIKIDVEVWKEESKKAESYYNEHRDDESLGWHSCCIHGISTRQTESWNTYGYKSENDVPYLWTELSENTPNIKRFWNDIFPSESYRRIRFMKLLSKGYISPHSDRPGKLKGEENFDPLSFGVPVNIAISHPKDCFMTLDNFGIVPFEEGKAFIINIKHFHSVINFSDHPRIHMIGHGKFGSKKEEFADMVMRSYYKQYERNRI